MFTADQFDRETSEVKNLGAPSRGVIEIKSPAEPVDDTATSAQVSKYWGRYKLVLVTNLRDWLLIGERGGQGNGSTAHLTAELFKLKTGTRMLHVPYKGDAPALADLLARHVNVMFGNVAAAAAHVRSGKLRLLAVTSSKRVAVMPDIPALNEVVPGVVAVAWFALVAPPRTPPEIAARLSATVADILRSPDIARRYAEVGAQPVGDTPEEMAAWMKEDTERWRAVIKACNVGVD